MRTSQPFVLLNYYSLTALNRLDTCILIRMTHISHRVHTAAAGACFENWNLHFQPGKDTRDGCVGNAYEPPAIGLWLRSLGPSPHFG